MILKTIINIMFMKTKIRNWCFFLIIIGNLLFAQEYKIQFSHIPIGQGVTLNDSVGIMNSIGGVVSKDVSSDSFMVGAGFLKTTQNVLA